MHLFWIVNQFIIGIFIKPARHYKGFFMNIPSSKEFSSDGISNAQIRMDKIYKFQYLWDEATMLRQMGLLPILRWYQIILSNQLI